MIPADCDNITSLWTPLPRNLSTTMAALFPINVRLRPTVTDATHGAVWLRARAWDGSHGDLRSAAPNATLVTGISQNVIHSAGGTSPFSSKSFVLMAVVHPAIEFPVIKPAVALQNVTEDTPSFENFGTTVTEIVQAPILTRLAAISESTVANLPSSPAGTNVQYQSLLPSANVGNYFTQVRSVNVLTSARRSAISAGSQPGIAINIPPRSNFGRWQISPSGNLSTWYFLDNLASTSFALLVPERARLRFLPVANYFGEPARLTGHSWDGVTSAAGMKTVTELYSVQIASTGRPQLSSTTIGSMTSVSVTVVNSDDRPTVSSQNGRLDAVPYRIRYHWDHLFTVTVLRSAADFCQERASFVDFMLLVLQHNITIRHVQPVAPSA